MDEESERALVERAQQGCNRALDRLLESRYPRMLSLARAILKNRDDALDATQEAAVRVVSNLHRLDSPAAFPSWSSTIVHRCCLSLLQQRNRYDRSTVNLDEVDGALARTPDRSDRLDDGITVGQIVGRFEDSEIEIVRLRLELGLSVRETAETLGVSEGAIKLRLHRARQKARRLARA